MAPGAVERCPDCDGQHFDWSEHDNSPVCTECCSLCPEVTLSLTNSSTDILDAFKKCAKDACSSDGNKMLSADEPLRDKFSKFVSKNNRRNTVNYRELWPCIDELARRLQPTLSIGDDLLSSIRRDLSKQLRTTAFNWKVRTDKRTLAYACFYKQVLDHGIKVRSLYYKYIASEESAIRAFICNSKTYKHYQSRLDIDKNRDGFLEERDALRWLKDAPKLFTLKHLAHACSKCATGDAPMSRITVNARGDISEEFLPAEKARMSNSDLKSFGRLCLRCAVDDGYDEYDMNRYFKKDDLDEHMTPMQRLENWYKEEHARAKFSLCIVTGKLAMELAEHACKNAGDNHEKKL